MDVEHIGVIKLAGGDIVYAQGTKGGPWLFFTGHTAIDFKDGLEPSVIGEPGRRFDGLSRHRREGDVLVGRFAQLLAASGSDMNHAVRLDQYYPSAKPVDPYHQARRIGFKEFIPPSTSVIVDELLPSHAGIDTSLIAVMPGDGRRPSRTKPEGVPVPEHSGFLPALVSGDYVFVAGQVANAESMDKLHPKAARAPTGLWNGTDIRLQTEFLITSRLLPALESGGSSLANCIKAQVYLTDINDMPDFMDVWTKYFGDHPCALTVVPISGLGFTLGVIEINIFGVRDKGAIRKEIIEHKGSERMRLGPAAVRAGSLLCLSGLFAADDKGVLADAAKANDLRHFGVPVQRQMHAVLGAADEICREAGTSLANTLRAHHFHTDLNDFYPAHRVWQSLMPGAPVPFGAVRVPAPLPVPGCDVLVDMWVYNPPR
jgi:enamine deaminase RidA (YjgF/YER057c/UK114 family)